MEIKNLFTLGLIGIILGLSASNYYWRHQALSAQESLKIVQIQSDYQKNEIQKVAVENLKIEKSKEEKIKGIQKEKLPAQCEQQLDWLMGKIKNN